MAHVPLPENLLSRLRRTAQQDGLSLTRLFEAMLELYLKDRHQPEQAENDDQDSSIHANSTPDPMQAEIEAFTELHSTLWQNYPNQYVAIYQGKLIDHDPNKLSLFERIEKSHPNEFVLMRPVQQQPTREFHFRSPRYIERSR